MAKEKNEKKDHLPLKNFNQIFISEAVCYLGFQFYWDRLETNFSGLIERGERN